jgi:hypothetical protein
MGDHLSRFAVFGIRNSDSGSARGGNRVHVPMMLRFFRNTRKLKQRLKHSGSFATAQFFLDVIRPRRFILKRITLDIAVLHTRAEEASVKHRPATYENSGRKEVAAKCRRVETP